MSCHLYRVVVRLRKQDKEPDELHFAVAAPNQDAALTRVVQTMEIGTPHRMRVTRVSGNVKRIPRWAGDL